MLIMCLVLEFLQINENHLEPFIESLNILSLKKKKKKKKNHLPTANKRLKLNLGLFFFFSQPIVYAYQRSIVNIFSRHI